MSSRNHAKPSAVLEVSMNESFADRFVHDDASVPPSNSASLASLPNSISANESQSVSSESQQPQRRIVPKGSLKPRKGRAGPRSKRQKLGDGTLSSEDADRQEDGPVFSNDRISTRLMGIPIHSITLGAPSLSMETFLSTWLNLIIPRYRMSNNAYVDPDEYPLAYRVNVDLSNKECLAALRPSFPFQGRNYQLIATKTQNEKGGGGNSMIQARFGKKKMVDMYYVTTSGPDVIALDLQEELEKIADFRSLPPYKVSSRLELFLTPSRDGCHWRTDLTADDFEIIPEDSHVGCGFIPEEFLHFLFPNNANTVEAVDSLQVRIFAPNIGIAKGMLVKKRGISRIQLPPSMIKVGASRINRSASWAVMIAKNVFPSATNDKFGRFLDPDEKDPPIVDLRSITKPLSDMYADLFSGLHVPKVLVDKYLKEIKSIENVRHAHVKGVRDPTGQLPENTIFVTGYTSDHKGNRVHMSELFPELFISRSPCLEPVDGKLLKVVSRKPYEMSPETWEWLRSMKFGHVFFSVPRDTENAVPLPMAIGNGDLDGDDYFICFHGKILSSLRKIFQHPRMKQEIAIQDEEIRQEHPNSETLPRVRDGSPTWLEDAQRDMLDLSGRNLVGRLTGTMYMTSKRVAIKSNDGIWDGDARALAKAYKSSLDYLKHRTKMELPARLKGEIKSDLHECIAWKRN